MSVNMKEIQPLYKLPGMNNTRCVSIDNPIFSYLFDFYLVCIFDVELRYTFSTATTTHRFSSYPSICFFSLHTNLSIYESIF